MAIYFLKALSDGKFFSGEHSTVTGSTFWNSHNAHVVCGHLTFGSMMKTHRFIFYPWHIILFAAGAV